MAQFGLVPPPRRPVLHDAGQGGAVPVPIAMRMQTGDQRPLQTGQDDVLHHRAGQGERRGGQQRVLRLRPDIGEGQSGRGGRGL